MRRRGDVGSAVGKAWGAVAWAAIVVGGLVGAVLGVGLLVGRSLGLWDVAMRVGSPVVPDGG